jgi:CRISPR-associated protein Csx10
MEKENIFRYEAIAPKQKFYGIIDISHVKGPLKKKIYDLLKKQRYIYLGGSRNTGYGKTLIENVEILEDLSKFDYLKQCESVEEHTYIYHLSDAILRDASHQISAGFHIGYLKKELELSNLEEREIESEINPVMITGYNQKWRCHNPHVYGVEKGSVVKINKEIKEIKANERFMKKQHGDRREDGLGRVIINPRFLEAKKICVLDENEREEVDCYEHYIKKDMDEAVIHRIKKDIKDHKIQRNMKSYIVKMLKKKDSNDRPYKNQIQNVIKVIDEVMIEKGNLFRQFKSKLENLEKITQNSNRNQKKNKVLTMEILKSGNHVYSLKKCMNLSQSEKTKIIQEIIKEDVENIDEIILKLIRNVLYYQTRKGEDDNDQ